MEIGEAVRRHGFWGLDRIKGSPVAHHLQDIEHHFADAPLARARTDERLQALLRHASSTTKFYRDFQGASLAEFPVIDKRTIKERYADFLSSQYEPNSLVSVTTSGSYGTPFTFQLTREKKARQLAEIIFFGRWAGWDVGVKYACLRATKPAFLADLLQNRVVLNVITFDRTCMKQQVRWLIDERVKILIGSVSGAHALAQYCREEAIPRSSLSLRGVITVGETLSEPVRAICEDAFACPVVGRYSSEELGVIAHECLTERQYHVNHASYLVELLHPTRDQAVGPGEVGRVVVTDLYSHAFPLIRYDIGDLAVQGNPCKCGLQGPVFASIEGRIVETIYDSLGRKLSPFVINHAMRDIADVVQYQFVQTAERDYVLKLVTLASFKEEGLILKRLQAILGDEARVRIELVPSIPPLPSGKRPYIINQWKAGSPHDG